MNQKAWKLHLENVDLRWELKAARDDVKRLTAARSCSYCGHPTRPGHRTCDAHRDLPAIDPGWRI